MKTKKFASTVFALALGLGVAFGINYVSAGTSFVGPTDTFPNCSSSNPACNPPINEGTTGQIKDGGLSVNALTAYMDSDFKQTVTLDQLAGSTQDGTLNQVCVAFDGTLELCNHAPSNGKPPLYIESRYGLSIDSVNNIPGFTLASPVHNEATEVTNGQHSSGALTTNVTVTLSGTPTEQQMITFNYYGPASSSDPTLLFTQCFNINPQDYDPALEHTATFDTSDGYGGSTTVIPSGLTLNPSTPLEILVSLGSSSTCTDVYSSQYF